MATVRRGEITLAVATDGASPALAAHLREKLEAAIGEEYATLADWLGELRPLVRETVTPETGGATCGGRSCVARAGSSARW